MSNKPKTKLHCLKDRILLNLIEKAEVSIPGHEEMSRIDIYRCPKCKMLYTSIDEYHDGESINIHGRAAINILPADDARRNLSHYLIEIKPGTKCYVFYKNQRPPRCRECNGTLLEKRIRWITPKNLIGSYGAFRCKKCNTFYIEIGTYLDHEQEWDPINETDVSLYKTTKHTLGRIPSKHALKQLHKLQTKETKEKTKKIKSEKKSITQITAHDFVVRTSVFKCRNKKHNIQDIQAIIISIGRHGEVNKIRVPAGYCPECNVYFIMDNIYKKIKKTGIPVCRAIDDKTYRKGVSSHPKGSPYDTLAQESVLKQFGYNVSQVDDLSIEQRQDILAAIVDYNVLKKSEIISYLEYFINNRKHQKNPDGSLKFKAAISKWKEDRDFVSDYKTGTFKKVNVAKIITYE